MTVSRQKHLWTTAILSTVIVILFSVLFFVLFFSTPEALPNPDIEPEKYTRQYLEAKEMVVLPPSLDTDEIVALEVEDILFEYVMVIDSCGPHYEGECLLARSGPGTDFAVITRLRNDAVLKVGGKVERDGEAWYKIVFDEWLRYPERAEGDMYVNAKFVEILYDDGDHTIWDKGYMATTSDKKIVVDRTNQQLTAYDGKEVFMEVPISTGLSLTPTPAGTFTIFKKTPSRYMQGPIPGLADQQVYDLPGVPWNLYFTNGGAVIHGAYWHDSFGRKYSHGCVNLKSSDARTLYNWATLGTKVVVKD